MMKNYAEPVEINHKPNWPYIPDHPYKILIIVGSWPSKNKIINNQMLTIFFLYVKDPFESKYQLLINRR